MSNKLLNQKWTSANGHVLAAQATKKKFDFTEHTSEIQTTIAFNVGQELADHIAQCHNEHLIRKEFVRGYREA